jgi:ADP-ribosylarginine hydrolase
MLAALWQGVSSYLCGTRHLTLNALEPPIDVNERYVASMVLSGVGDALGYHNGWWEFCKNGSQIHREMEELGGLHKIKIKLPGWMVSDDTVMHLATAEALAEHRQLEPDDNLYRLLAKKYKNCMNDMDGRGAGNTCISSCGLLRPECVDGYKTIKFSEWHGGCGAAMRAMCIGLRYPDPHDLDQLIAVSIESGRMTHNCPKGFLGALAAALFVHYAIQGKPLKEWGAGLMDVLDKAMEYIRMSGRDVHENEKSWHNFVDPWEHFLKVRGIRDGKSKPKFDKQFSDVWFRDSFYLQFTVKDGWPGACGHDAPMIAYDALLASGDDWEELCKRAMLHGGDNDTTGVIAGACFGALYGFAGVPLCHYEELEYRRKLEKVGEDLLALGQPHNMGQKTAASKSVRTSAYRQQTLETHQTA